jgi:hypothetical protein
VFDPGPRDPLLGAEVGGRRKQSDNNWFGAGLDAGLSNAGWLALPIVAVLGLCAVVFVAWQRFFGGRR